MLRILHAADIHLDSPLRGLDRYEGTPAERLRLATRRAFTRLIDLALDEKVDLVLIAGDLYDGDWTDFNTGLFLNQQLRRLGDADIPVVVIAGNHDAANRMTRSLPWPANVHRLDHRRPVTQRFESLGVAVHGQSYACRDVTDDLSKNYPLPERRLAQHRPAPHRPDRPRRPRTLRPLHPRRPQPPEATTTGPSATSTSGRTIGADPLVVFPGNIQGRHVQESGEKGCEIFTVEANRITDRAFHRLDVVHWQRLEVDATDVATESDLFDRASAALDQALYAEKEPDALLAIRVEIRGRCGLHDRLLGRREQTVAGIRDLAIDRGRDRLWLERVQFQTEPARLADLPDGPLQELRGVVADLADDPSLTDLVNTEIADLLRKLPSEIREAGEVVRLNDPAWLQDSLQGVLPLLRQLIRDVEAPAAP